MRVSYSLGVPLESLLGVPFKSPLGRSTGVPLRHLLNMDPGVQSGVHLRMSKMIKRNRPFRHEPEASAKRLSQYFNHSHTLPNTIDLHSSSASIAIFVPIRL